MKKILLFIVMIWAVSAVRAQDMAPLFVAMPDAMVPQLEDAWRKDLIDLYTSGKEAKLKNTMNGMSSLKKLTDNYLLLQVSDNSTIELKLFPLVNNTEIIGMITTVNGPVPDSRIAFYTTEWQPLNADDLFTPPSGDWFIKENADKQSEAYVAARSYLDMDLIKYAFNPDAFTLTATYTTPQYLNKEDQKKVTPFLKEKPVVYTWQKFHFK